MFSSVPAAGSGDFFASLSGGRAVLGLDSPAPSLTSMSGLCWEGSSEEPNSRSVSFGCGGVLCTLSRRSGGRWDWPWGGVQQLFFPVFLYKNISTVSRANKQAGVFAAVAEIKLAGLLFGFLQLPETFLFPPVLLQTRAESTAHQSAGWKC